VNVVANSVYGHDDSSATELFIRKLHYISNIHSYKTVENRTHVDITFFTENDLRDHHLKL
jgi:hypothetical protein